MLTPLNRSAVIITPRQSFFDMIAKISGAKPEKAVAPLTEDESTIYLIQEADLNELDLKERMANSYKEIFFEELEGWFTDTSRWPKDVTWQEFTEWFHISYQSVILDTLDEEIEYV
ncbi:MAG: hypothetical protein JW881_04500 [Spirochaetales bacterium]|nr:hypothetical protein [Spirochaetales bacterium]